MSGFSFGFSGDDIDIDDSELNAVNEGDVSLPQGNQNELPPLMEARKHDMKEWVSPPRVPSASAEMHSLGYECPFLSTCHATGRSKERNILPYISLCYVNLLESTCNHSI